MFIHKDVLEAIQNNYFSLIDSGADLNQIELMDLIKVNKQMIDQEVSGLRESLGSYLELQERHLLTFKLFNGFLQLHDLEYEFDNYFERIQRKMNKLNLS